MGGFLQNIYNGIENILRQVLGIRGVEVPRSDTWHQELLRRSMSSGIISEGLAAELRDYLSFRHFFVHGYGFMLNEAKLQDLADRLPDVWSRFQAEIERSFSDA